MQETCIGQAYSDLAVIKLLFYLKTHNEQYHILHF